ncbi:hypothetical protein SPRG_08124 [Saprolegnia parasitica CBS 223.65]|uniref:Uncharacterized protein n=1 Tax=Saprolegnia parasitica (strain CBS 223.65) TaxID=695850 RepID=A0A067C8L0_SAPPC|nr:hypothetical protein SPRG_08124 [Saprolegnia parasitica CBS 223.65]KDO26833.1 hypothetical protein SPRG_08124 [Saprolegnia parasitica CBS 223.65]|eukprot:XP_012202479.1 hypothetical protein SPRG_08124 [Saprolegnia parasitica CBS 223.65]
MAATVVGCELALLVSLALAAAYVWFLFYVQSTQRKACRVLPMTAVHPSTGLRRRRRRCAVELIAQCHGVTAAGHVDDDDDDLPDRECWLSRALALSGIALVLLFIVKVAVEFRLIDALSAEQRLRHVNNGAIVD